MTRLRCGACAPGLLASKRQQYFSAQLVCVPCGALTLPPSSQPTLTLNVASCHNSFQCRFPRATAAVPLANVHAPLRHMQQIYEHAKPSAIYSVAVNKGSETSS